MSGDVQPRKRKDKKKQKDDDGYSPINEDVNIHVHKEGGLGGNICAKIVFFFLFSALIVLIGLIIKENQGLTELEEVESESKYSQIFEGWVDKSTDEHEDDHSAELSHEDDHDLDEDDHDESEENYLKETYEHSDESNIEDNDSDEQDEDEDSKTKSEEETNEVTEEDEVPESEEDNTIEEDTEEVDEQSESQEKDRDVTDEEGDNLSEPGKDDDIDDDDDDDDDNDTKGETKSKENSIEGNDDEDSKENNVADESDEDVKVRVSKREISKETLGDIKEEPQKEQDKEVLTGALIEEEQKEEIQGEPAPPSSGNVNVGEEAESDSDKEDYEHSNITNKNDFKIKADIDAAQEHLDKNAAYANNMFEALLDKHPLSPRTLYGKARALDIMAEEKQSNELLLEALDYYIKALNSPDVPDQLFVIIAERYIDRARFIGHYKKAISAHWQLTERFPDNRTYLNNLAVTYLTINLIEEARSVLKRVLSRWPNDGFALVHYGFILKTSDNNLKESVEYMKRGLKTKDSGVIDGRFYFHLGDALTRLNKNEEAMKLYEEGVQEKVFMSKYQRSLYNVPTLTAKPWWEPADLPSYQTLFKTLKDSWQDIRREGLSALNDQGYFRDEAENLKDTGSWKQLELFARGQKFTKNCAISPVTCNVIQRFPESRNCRRGQSKFSVMHPGTHVWPHCGPTNCRLRIHLGLKVPPNTFIRVAEQTRSWNEGDIIIFDDSFEHEVWHNGSDFRLVLIVDVWHPELTPSEKKSLSSI